MCLLHIVKQAFKVMWKVKRIQSVFSIKGLKKTNETWFFYKEKWKMPLGKNPSQLGTFLKQSVCSRLHPTYQYHLFKLAWNNVRLSSDYSREAQELFVFGVKRALLLVCTSAWVGMATHPTAEGKLFASSNTLDCVVISLENSILTSCGRMKYIF